MATTTTTTPTTTTPTTTTTTTPLAKTLSNTLRRSYPGWKKWAAIPSFVPFDSGEEGIRPVPFGESPDGYFPSNKFWGSGSAIHLCLKGPRGSGLSVGTGEFLPWMYAIGAKYPAPTLGYCLGESYREYVYGQIIVAVDNLEAGLDVFERSKLKRIYVNHGEVRGYRTENGKFYLDIGLDGFVNPEVMALFSSSGMNINISSTTISKTVTVKSLKSNWEIEISDPGKTTNSAGQSIPVTFATGDFYQFSETWCIEDPLLMSGRWMGNENEKVSDLPNSGYGVHITDNNVMYDVVEIMGFYVWKDDGGEIVATSSTSPLKSSSGGDWYWYAYPQPVPPIVPPEKETPSYIYDTDPNRWKIVSNANATTTTTTTTIIGPTRPVVEDAAATFQKGLYNIFGVTQEKFKKAEKDDIGTWLKLPNISFVRIEISDSGGARKNNWHVPILTKCWVKQKDKYFKIMGQPDGCTIDVSIKDVTGTTDFDVGAFGEISIFNQYAWMLNEIYAQYNGIFEGELKDNTYDKTTGISSLTIHIKNKAIPSGMYETGYSRPKPAPKINGVEIQTTEGAVGEPYNPDYLIANPNIAPVTPEDPLVPNSGGVRVEVKPVNSFYNRFRCDPKPNAPTSFTMTTQASEQETKQTPEGPVLVETVPTKTEEVSSEFMETTDVPMKKYYVKNMNWMFVGNDTDTAYEIERITFSDFPYFPSERSTGYNLYFLTQVPPDYDVFLKVKGDTTKEKIGHITFDDPYKRTIVSKLTKMTGILLYTDVVFGAGSSQISSTSINAYQNTMGGGLLAGAGNVYIDMQWLGATIQESISGGTMVGVCGGSWFGLNAFGCDFVKSDNGALLYFTTPYGLNCISSMFNHIIQEDCVVYNDIDSSKVTIRRGALGFREFPQKTEIVVGGDTFTESVTAPIILNKNRQRLKSIRFTTPEDTSKSGKALFFKIGPTEGYYGFLVSGRGIVDLQTLRKSNVAAGSVSSSVYEYNSLVSSPVYTYQKSLGSKIYDLTFVDLGLDTSAGSIKIVDNDNVVKTPSDIKLEYCNNNQLLEDIGYFDFFKMLDGEILLIYGQGVTEFRVNGKTNNSSSGASKWPTSSAIFIIGTGDESSRWGCPLVKDLSQSPTPWLEYEGTGFTPPAGATLPGVKDFRLPLMVLPSCEYLGGVFHKYSNTLFLFAKCYLEGQDPYIGCFSLKTSNLVYRLYKCALGSASTTAGTTTTTTTLASAPTEDLPFLFRPLSIPEDRLTDTTTSYSVPNVITNMPKETQFTDMDDFVRVLGSTGTNCQITSDDVPNIISPFVMANGTLGALYDSDSGIKLMYSRSGITWKESPIILAADAHSPCYIDDMVIAYITDSGIEVKINHDLNTLAAMEVGDMGLTEGDYAQYKESIQKGYDDLSKTLIGSGQISAQKLSGYITAEGVYRIFYYDINGLLTCSESKNLVQWNVSPNF